MSHQIGRDPPKGKKKPPPPPRPPRKRMESSTDQNHLKFMVNQLAECLERVISNIKKDGLSSGQINEFNLMVELAKKAKEETTKM